MALSDIFGGLNDLLKDTTDFAKGVMGSVNEFKTIFDPDRNNTPAKTQTQPAYTPNVTPGDLAFTPNMKLLFGGAVLLLIALVFLKR